MSNDVTHEQVPLFYTRDDDGVWISCCDWEQNLGHDATLQSAVAAHTAHVAAATNARMPLYGVQLSYPGTTRAFVMHVNASSEDDARDQARKLEPNAEIGMAELVEHHHHIEGEGCTDAHCPRPEEARQLARLLNRPSTQLGN